MLQQILQDMYIDPEILAELSEEQTQVLYYKMREEQIRRYNVWSSEEEKKPPPRKKGRKNINWKLGNDGDIWVWVMGEHRNDIPYEVLLEEARQKEARRLAEEELKAQRAQQEEEERRLQKEEEAKQKKLREEEERLAKVKQELELKRRKAEEAAIYASLKEARLAKQQEEKLEKERKEAERREEELREKERALLAARLKRSEENRKREKELEKRLTERSEDLYMSVSQVRAEQVKMVEKEKEKVEQIWQVQLRKIKLADKNRAMIAKRAREEVRKSKTLSQDMDALTLEDLLKKNAQLNKSGNTTNKKRASREDVISWYKSVELPKGSGLKKGTKIPEKWFHGCINRTQAAELLNGKSTGSFLIRLSEKVLGYALSFKDSERVKHFLIDASEETYHFFGTDQINHKSLSDLVKFHKERPITFSGQEILTDACGQKPGIPDYKELF